MISLPTNFAENTFLLLNLFLTQEKDAADLHSSAKLPQIVTKLKGNVNLWMNVAENLLPQKCFVFRGSVEGKRYQIAETKLHEFKIYHFVGKSCKPAMFHTSCLCELVKRG